MGEIEELWAVGAWQLGGAWSYLTSAVAYKTSCVWNYQLQVLDKLPTTFWLPLLSLSPYFNWHWASKQLTCVLYLGSSLSLLIMQFLPNSCLKDVHLTTKFLGRDCYLWMEAKWRTKWRAWKMPKHWELACLLFQTSSVAKAGEGLPTSRNSKVPMCS